MVSWEFSVKWMRLAGFRTMRQTIHYFYETQIPLEALLKENGFVFGRLIYVELRATVLALSQLL